MSSVVVSHGTRNSGRGLLVSISRLRSVCAALMLGTSGMCGSLSASTSSGGNWIRVSVRVLLFGLEPMFAAEAKERYAETVGRPSKQSEVNSPQIERALQARDRRRQEAHERKDVLQRLSDLFVCKGVPGHIRSDNGSEFRAKCVREWLGELA